MVTAAARPWMAARARCRARAPMLLRFVLAWLLFGSALRSNQSNQ